MKGNGLIIATSIRNNLSLKVVLLTAVGMLLLCVAGVVVALSLLLIAPAMRSGAPDRAEMELYLGLIMYISCLIGVGINMNVFAFQSMTREKARGNLESLLATPLGVRQVWVAKSMAVFLPGLVLGEVFAIASVIIVNYIYFVPELGFLFSPWMTVSSLVALPLIYAALSLLVHLVGLTGKAMSGNIIVQVFLPVFANVMAILLSRHVLEASSVSFTLLNFGVAAVIGALVLWLMPRLSAEKIVLSR